MKRIVLFLAVLAFSANNIASACSILYYIDSKTGKIYAVNNEDYWYDVRPYIKILPATKTTLARLWYGWDNFAQGGINEQGLFFDGAATPEQPPVAGYSKPRGNLGDDILSSCHNVQEALALLEERKTGLTNGHLLFGDRAGNAAVAEWVNGVKKIIPISGDQLMITNFLLSDTSKGNYPCIRYSAMEKEVARLRQSRDTAGLKEVGGIAAKAVQVPAKNAEGRVAGTLYSTFFNITDMQFVLVYKLDNTKITRLDLKRVFAENKKQTISLE